MPRIDVWDVARAREHEPPIDCGYPRDIEAKYEWKQEIGKGGFGVVRVVQDRQTGEQLACKTISKKLNLPNLSVAKQAQHIDNIKREVEVLKRLRGSLNVAQFKGVAEDNTSVHILMEWCRGGELPHRIGQGNYSERTVASFMRAVLRTIAQCHSHRILHRDIKPGNFMLLNDEPTSPVKAIDFGLAVMYDPQQLPRSDLGLEGTPWFMAPEVLSSQTVPASDVWSAGVMAYQLLSGRLPFDDRRNPDAPALSLVWRAILTEEAKFAGTAWADISDQAKDFVKSLLTRDVASRPSARDALKHPWLAGSIEERHSGKPISQTVVQRIQRYAQGNALKKSIFELIASELLRNFPISRDPTQHGRPGFYRPDMPQSPMKPQQVQQQGPGGSPMRQPLSPAPHSADSRKRAAEDGNLDVRPEAEEGDTLEARAATVPSRDGQDEQPAISRVSMQRVGSAHAGLGGPHSSEASSPSLRKGNSTHHGRSYWRLLRAAATAAKLQPQADGSGHGEVEYVRMASRSEVERQEHRKAARLMLDTSAHAGAEYLKLMRQTSDPTSDPQLPAAPPALPAPPSAPAHLEAVKDGSESRPSLDLSAEGGRRAKGLYKQYIEASGGAVAGAGSQQQGSGEPPLASCQQEAGLKPALAHGGHPHHGTHVHFGEAGPAVGVQAAGPWESGIAPEGLKANAFPSEIRDVMRSLHFTKEQESVAVSQLAEGLARLGYSLQPSEMAQLMEQMDLDADGVVQSSHFLASQIDWQSLQNDYREQWLECARRAFGELDKSATGLVKPEQFVDLVRSKLPAMEVEYAVEDALMDAGHADADGIDFESFVRMLQLGTSPSNDQLDQYESRHVASHSHHGGTLFSNASASGMLDTVDEHQQPQ